MIVIDIKDEAVLDFTGEDSEFCLYLNGFIHRGDMELLSKRYLFLPNRRLAEEFILSQPHFQHIIRKDH